MGVWDGIQGSFAGGAYSTPLTPWLHLRGPTSKARGKGERVNKGEKGGSKKGVFPQSSPQIYATGNTENFKCSFCDQ